MIQASRSRPIGLRGRLAEPNASCSVLQNSIRSGNGSLSSRQWLWEFVGEERGLTDDTTIRAQVLLAGRSCWQATRRRITSRRLTFGMHTDGEAKPGPVDLVVPDLLLRNASEADVPLILKFIRDLAEYEPLTKTVVATEHTIRASLF